MGRVKINPKILQWAREDAGYTYQTLPKHLQKNFIYWEKGERQPTWNQLCDISKQLKRPTAFFFRKNPPKTSKINFMEYRKTNHTTQTRTPQLNIAIRQFMYKRQKFIELMEEMNIPKKDFSKYTIQSENVGEISSYIRDILGVSIETQKKWIYTTKHNKDNLH